jgi:acetolactate synthase I/II/III large subunit
MRVSDYISKKLVDLGARHVFMVTGGGSMFLNDALGHTPALACTFNHHEQACAMAAEAYARITNTPAVVNVTTGPGGINALNGVFGAWVDSIPMLILSGQVKRETLMATYDIPGLRQIGDQEADIISMAKSITKYAVLVKDPREIRFHLEKAWHLATHGRPGPCWLDIPIDVQTSDINPEELSGFSPDTSGLAAPEDLTTVVESVVKKLSSAERPVILAGKGIRLANALDDFESVIHTLQVPVVPGWTAIDLLSSDDPLFCGRAGDLATRAGNFAVQNADVLLVLGNRLGLRQVSYNWKSFARYAYKIQVDIDPAELNKPTVQAELPIHADVKVFLSQLVSQLTTGGYSSQKYADWLAWCKERVIRYPPVLPRHRKSRNGEINPYYFIERLFECLGADDVVVCGDGTANVVTFQAAAVKNGQRVFANTGDAAMGYDLPAAIGAAVARGGKRVICLAGDGSLQLNIQEFQTIVHNQLPIKLFVLSNDGYLSIRQSQMNMFHRLTGEGPRSGVSFPDIVKVADAYGLRAMRIQYGDLEESIVSALTTPGAVVCDVRLDPEQGFEPRITARQLPDGSIVSSPLEDMYPFLEDFELEENLRFPPLR